MLEGVLTTRVPAALALTQGDVGGRVDDAGAGGPGQAHRSARHGPDGCCDALEDGQGPASGSTAD